MRGKVPYLPVRGGAEPAAGTAAREVGFPGAVGVLVRNGPLLLGVSL